MLAGVKKNLKKTIIAGQIIKCCKQFSPPLGQFTIHDNEYRLERLERADLKVELIINVIEGSYLYPTHIGIIYPEKLLEPIY